MDRVNPNRIINFDCNSTTSVSADVLKAMVEIPQGNSHSFHREGVRANLVIKKAENHILSAINGHKGYIIWTASGSEANRLAIESCCTQDGHLITTKVEHKSIEILQNIYKRTLDVDKNGLISVKKIKESIFKDTQLVSIIYVNNEIGTIQPIKEIKKAIGNTCLHIDAVQALGKIPIDVEDLGCDMLSLSAHKIHGPKGIGCLWIRNGTKINLPYLGTLNTAGIVGFGQAVLKLNPKEKIFAVKEANFINELNANDIEYEFNVDKNGRVPGTLSLYFPEVDAEELMLRLSDLGVLVSVGSACNSKTNGLSHVLLAIGLSEKRIRSTLRVSISCLSPIDIIDGVGLLAQAIGEIKNGF